VLEEIKPNFCYVVEDQFSFVKNFVKLYVPAASESCFLLNKHPLVIWVCCELQGGFLARLVERWTCVQDKGFSPGWSSGTLAISSHLCASVTKPYNFGTCLRVEMPCLRVVMP